MWRWDQAEPFGVNVPDENPAGLGAFEFPGRFPGQYFDKETNLHYNYYRDYDPSLGIYKQSDLIGLRGGVNTYSYVRATPLTARDVRGLETTVITVRDWGVGTHSAVHVQTPGQSPFVYDPAGSYQGPSGEPRGSGDFFEGKDANLRDYIKWHEDRGSTVETTKLPTTPEQEKEIKRRAEERGGAFPFACTTAASDALGGVCGIGRYFLPDSLGRAAKGAVCKP